MIKFFMIIFFLFFIQNCEECNCKDKVRKAMNEYGEPCSDVVIDHAQDGYMERNLVYMAPNIHSDSLWVKFYFFWGSSINSCCNKVVYEFIPDSTSNLCSEDMDVMLINEIDFEYANYNNNCISCP